MKAFVYSVESIGTVVVLAIEKNFANLIIIDRYSDKAITLMEIYTNVIS
jgi:hypothetical protein